jgi:predicted Zn-dependent peptidase
MQQSSMGTLEQIRDRVFTCLTQLIEQVLNAGRPIAEFQEAQEALETLPLTRAEFATAQNRLLNARSYLEAGEPGAALYELRLLWRSLDH